MQDDGSGNLGGGRQQIIGERAREESAVWRINIFFVDSRSYRMGKSAGHLAGDHSWMKYSPAVVHGDVFVNAYRRGEAIDLDAAKIEDEAVAERRISFIVLRRRGELRRRPEHGLAQSLRALGHHA